MRIFIDILLGICTVASVVTIFIPINDEVTIKIKWIVLFFMLAILIILWLIYIIIKKRKEERAKRSTDNDKVYITDIKFENNDIIIYFQKNQIYHVDALVCVYEDVIPDSKLIAIGEVEYCENNYTKIKIIKIINEKCFNQYRDDRRNMDRKIFVITSFKKDYIHLLNRE